MATEQTGPQGERQPLPGPADDVRPPLGLTPRERAYLQGDALPATSSILISSSKYLNNPYYREAYAMQALRRHGPDLPPTYMVPYMVRAIDEVTDKARLDELIAAEKVRLPEFGAWLDARSFTVFTPENTAGFAPGTLGHALNDFLGIPGMDIEFLSRSREVTSDADYIAKRRVGSHDIEHIVSGFGADTAGECALNMLIVTASARYFTPELAQMLTQTQVWVTSAGYNRTALHYHHALPAYLDAMQQGIRAGQAIRRPLFMTAWEDYLDWQLDDIAADLGFTRGDPQAWTWTNEATCG